MYLGFNRGHVMDTTPCFQYQCFWQVCNLHEVSTVFSDVDLNISNLRGRGGCQYLRWSEDPLVLPLGLHEKIFKPEIARTNS